MISETPTKLTVEIEPNRNPKAVAPFPNIMIVFQFVNKNPKYGDVDELYTMLHNGKIVKGKLTAEQKRLSFTFSPQNRVFRRVMDFSINGQNETQKTFLLEQVKFFENLPDVEVQYKEVEGKVKQNTNFSMNILENMENKVYNKLIEKNMVCSAVLDCDYEKQKEICYYFGGNPSTLTPQQLVIDLADFGSGRLMSDKNAKEFLTIYNGEASELVKVSTEVRKAIALGVIKTDDGKYFLPNGEQIGFTVEACIMYLKANNSAFTLIKNAANEKDKAETLKQKDSIEKSEEFKVMRDKLKGYGVKNWFAIKADDLAIKLKAYEDAKEEGKPVFSELT